MAYVHVVSGDIEPSEWLLAKSSLVRRHSGHQEIPIKDIVELQKNEQIKKKCYVQVTLGTKQSFVATMDEDIYGELYDLFVKIGNSPVSSELPRDVEPEKADWFSRVGIAGVAVLAFMFFQLIPDGNPSIYTTDVKAKLCKSYIGDMFNRPFYAIDHYQTDDDGNVYVKYKRSSDGKVWKYACVIENDTMSWVGWLPDTLEWGRIRDEDKVRLKHSKSYVEYKSPVSGKMLAVKL